MPNTRSGSSLKVHGPIAVADLTGREVTDELSLTLAQEPAYCVRQEQEDGSDRYALVLGQALGRRALMDLLYTLAPYKAHGPDRFARVLDNWGIHDRAAANNGSQGLFLQHAQSLKLSWDVFTQHRELYMAIFRDQTESTRAVPLLTWEKDAAGARKWRSETPDTAVMEALADTAPILQGRHDEARTELDTLLGLVTIPYLMPQLCKDWPAWKPLVKDGKSNYIGPASVPVMAHLHRRALLNSAVVRNAEAWTDSATSK